MRLDTAAELVSFVASPATRTLYLVIRSTATSAWHGCSTRTHHWRRAWRCVGWPPRRPPRGRSRATKRARSRAGLRGSACASAGPFAHESGLLPRRAARRRSRDASSARAARPRSCQGQRATSRSARVARPRPRAGAAIQYPTDPTSPIPTSIEPRTSPRRVHDREHASVLGRVPLACERDVASSLVFGVRLRPMRKEPRHLRVVAGVRPRTRPPQRRTQDDDAVGQLHGTILAHRRSAALAGGPSRRLGGHLLVPLAAATGGRHQGC